MDSPSHVVYRDATNADLDAIRCIFNDEIKGGTNLYDYEPYSSEKVKSWFDQRLANGMPVLVADSNGELAGFCSFDIFRPKAGYRFSVEHTIYLREAFRGRTIGSNLMQLLIDHAKVGGYHTMIAGIDGSNKASIAFHRKFGFEEVALFKEAGYKFDQWLDLVFMQLMLTR